MFYNKQIAKQAQHLFYTPQILEKGHMRVVHEGRLRVAVATQTHLGVGHFGDQGFLVVDLPHAALHLADLELLVFH